MKLGLVLGNSESAAASRAKPEEAAPANWMGMTVAELPREMRMRGATGVVITEIDAEGLAAEAGLQRGDIIVSVNRNRVGNLAEYNRAVAGIAAKGSAVLLVKRGNASIYFVLKAR